MKWSFKSAFFLVLFLLSVCFSSNGQLLNGKVIDSKTGQPLAFVNIGIVNHDIGTVSNDIGEFKILLQNSAGDDTLKFSIIGYKPQSWLINKVDLKEFMIVKLEETFVELKEVVIVADKGSDKTKILGSKGVSGFMETGWAGGSFGGERGIKVSSKEKFNVLAIQYHIANNGYDSVLLRLHIRALKNRMPDTDQELLSQNIFIIEKNKKGWSSKSLEEYNITIEGEVAITLELLKYWGKCAQIDCFHLSMDVPGGAFFYKMHSFSSWQKKKGRSPSLYLSGQKY